MMLVLFILLRIMIITSSLPIIKAIDNDDYHCSNKYAFCSAGCWDETTNLNTNELVCVPVVPGFYSPQNDNNQYICPAGTYSSIYGASKCSICPVGTYTYISGSTYCYLCDTTYYDKAGSNSAFLIKDTVYCTLIRGSNTDDQQPILIDSPPNQQEIVIPQEVPPSSVTTPYTHSPTTQAPSATRSTIPTSIPSTTSPTKVHYTSLPSKTTLTDDPLLNKEESSSTSFDEQNQYQPTTEQQEKEQHEGLVEEDFVCNEDHYLRHGVCISCPKTILTTLLPILLLLIFVRTIIFLVNRVSSNYYCITTLFIAIDYFQVLFLMGIANISWSTIVEYGFMYLSVFAFDINKTVLPLQCYLLVSQQGDHILILITPFIMWLCTSLFIQHYLGRTMNMFPSIKKWFVIILYVAYIKLLVSSLDAMSCSTILQKRVRSDDEIDWFCISSSKNPKDKISAIFGFIGLLLYGLGYPLWLFQKLRIAAYYRCRNNANNAEKEKQQQPHDGSRSHQQQKPHEQQQEDGVDALSTTSHSNAASPADPTTEDNIDNWTSLFLEPFHPKVWLWSETFLFRKIVLVILVFSLLDNPKVMILLLFISEGLFSIIQWYIQPFLETNNNNGLDHNNNHNNFSFAKIAIWMQLGLLCNATIGLMFEMTALSDEKRIGLTFLWLCCTFSSLLFLLCAFCHYIKYDDLERRMRAHGYDANDNDKTQSSTCLETESSQKLENDLMDAAITDIGHTHHTAKNLRPPPPTSPPPFSHPRRHSLTHPSNSNHNVSPLDMVESHMMLKASQENDDLSMSQSNDVRLVEDHSGLEEGQYEKEDECCGGDSPIVVDGLSVTTELQCHTADAQEFMVMDDDGSVIMEQWKIMTQSVDSSSRVSNFCGYDDFEDDVEDDNDDDDYRGHVLMGANKMSDEDANTNDPGMVIEEENPVTILQPSHRVQPSIWGKIHSSVYQPK